METTSARASISLETGTIEFSGSEDFVEKQVEKFRELVLERLGKVAKRTTLAGGGAYDK